MTLLNPILLWAGLGAVALPILIHILMRRRRRPVQWAAMRFLLEAYQKQRKRTKLEQILLLAARCLLLALLGAALARPLVGEDSGLGGGGGKTLFVLIDNSLTSGALDPTTGEAEIENAKRTAIDLIDGLDSAMGDRAALIALGGPAEALVLPASGDLGAVKDLIVNLGVTDSRADLRGAAGLVSETLAPDEESGEPFPGSAVVAVLGGFRSGSVDTATELASLPPSSSGPVKLIASSPAAAPAPNLSISQVRPLRDLVLSGSAASTPVSVRVERDAASTDSGVTARVRLSLAAGGETAPLGERDITLGPGQRSGEASFAADLARALAVIEASGVDASAALVATVVGESDSLGNDNVRRSVVELRPRLRVGIIGPQRFGGRPAIDDFGPADWVRLAMSPLDDSAQREAEIEVTTLPPGSVDGPRLGSFDAVVVTEPQRVSETGWDALARFAGAGGAVIVSPDATATVHQWPERMARALGLDITSAPEPIDLESREPLVPVQNSDDGGLLSLIGAELPELLRPVTVSRLLPLTPTPGGEGEVALTAGGRPALWISAGASKNQGGGLVAVMGFAPDLSWTDLPAKPAMVPLMQELVRQGAGAARGWNQRTAGKEGTLPPGAATLRGPRGTERQAGESPIRRAGLWTIRDERGASLALTAINPDLDASDTRPLQAEQVRAWLSGLAGGDETTLSWIGDDEGSGSASAQLADRQEPWTLPLLIAVAALAVLEVFFGRAASHAGRPLLPEYFRRRLGLGEDEEFVEEAAA